jgi:hypothetical protein
MGCTYLNDPTQSGWLLLDPGTSFIGIQFRLTVPIGATVSSAVLIMTVDLNGWLNGTIAAIADGSMSAYDTDVRAGPGRGAPATTRPRRRG